MDRAGEQAAPGFRGASFCVPAPPAELLSLSHAWLLTENRHLRGAKRSQDVKAGKTSLATRAGRIDGVAKVTGSQALCLRFSRCGYARLAFAHFARTAAPGR